MTVSAAGFPASLNAIPQTQNSAAVLEFQCLYTADLRRKQKRWQDGRLKYHTFNKRIMVYDDRGNFVGDSHWREDHAFGEGEEVELERCGILVEVSECVGSREQDLTPLLSKVVNDRHERAHTRAVASSPLKPPEIGLRTQTVGLSRVEPIRSAKRRKPNSSPSSKNGYAQNLTGATLTLSGSVPTSLPLRHDLAWSRLVKQPVEQLDMSNSTGMNQIAQVRTLSVKRDQIKGSGCQAVGFSKKPSPARPRSSSPRGIAGPAPASANKILTDHGAQSAPEILITATNRLDENSPAATIIEEDEFIDIDKYDTDFRKVENAKKFPSGISGLEENLQMKPSANLLLHQPSPEGVQLDRPFNPLRIRTRPKRKLISAASPSSRLPPSNELTAEDDNEAIFPPTSSKSERKGQLSVAPSLQRVSNSDTISLCTNEPHSSFPAIDGMDHNGIDVLLTRKVSGKTSRAEELFPELQASTRNTISNQSAGELKDFVAVEAQNTELPTSVTVLSLEPAQKVTQRSRKLSPLQSGTDIGIEKTSTRKPKNICSPPQMVNFLSEGAQPSELRRLMTTTTTEDTKILRSTHQLNRDLTIKRDVVPFKPPAKLPCATMQSMTPAQKGNSKEGGFLESAKIPAITSSRSVVPILADRTAGEHTTGNRNQGPWSREAFDLFDWKPGSGARTASEELAACVNAP